MWEGKGEVSLFHQKLNTTVKSRKNWMFFACGFELGYSMEPGLSSGYFYYKKYIKNLNKLCKLCSTLHRLSDSTVILNSWE